MGNYVCYLLHNICKIIFRRQCSAWLLWRVDCFKMRLVSSSRPFFSSNSLVDPGQSEKESPLATRRKETSALNLALGHGRDFTRLRSLFPTNKLRPTRFYDRNWHWEKNWVLAGFGSFLNNAFAKRIPSSNPV